MAKKKKASTKKTETAVQTIPTRDKVRQANTWDLTVLCKNDQQWDVAFTKWAKRVDRFEQFRGKVTKDAKSLAACLKFELEMSREGELLGVYAFLKTTEDLSNNTYQAMKARFMNIAAKAGELSSFILPEIMATPAKQMTEMLKQRSLAPYRLIIQRMLRNKPHVLGKKEERLLAMQAEMAQAASQIFDQLNDTDMNFGTIRNDSGELTELTHSTYGQMQLSPKRAVRKKAFEQLYKEYQSHENTLAATLGGSMQSDVYYAKARNHKSARGGVMFNEFIPESVYDNLVTAVRGNLPALHRYYEVRRRKMKLKEIHIYDTRVPILSDMQVDRSWSQAVSLIMASLKPLGKEYCDVLSAGLKGRWCDRYENKNKNSGAFCCGSFDAPPFILMNYKPTVPSSAFTLAHEAGHAMHSYFSSKSQPYHLHDYKLFVAEVASTFNEQLLSHHMMKRAKTDDERAYLITREIDGIRGTIFRQTMFAEFEKITHEMLEQGQPLTVDVFKCVYHELLEAYFGPDFVLDPQLDLECFRIPHFYRSFYVYKYATGLSAAIALADRVLQGGKSELDDYLGFLNGGCSKESLDLLRDAGVDMEQPQAVDTALARFGELVDELDRLI